MPPKTTVPIALLAGSAGSAGEKQGSHPQDEGKEVITMGRKRRLVASMAASSTDIPSAFEDPAQTRR